MNISAGRHPSRPTLMFFERESNSVHAPAGLAMIPYFGVRNTCLPTTFKGILLYVDNHKHFEVCCIGSDPTDSIILIESMFFKLLSICMVGFQRTVSATTSQYIIITLRTSLQLLSPRTCVIHENVSRKLWRVAELWEFPISKHFVSSGSRSFLMLYISEKSM